MTRGKRRRQAEAQARQAQPVPQMALDLATVQAQAVRPPIYPHMPIWQESPTRARRRRLRRAWKRYGRPLAGFVVGLLAAASIYAAGGAL